MYAGALESLDYDCELRVHSQAVEVPIDLIDSTSSPRSAIDNSHVNIISNLGAESLPPILVQQGSMRLIDGLHRLYAAKKRGDQTIHVLYFDGDDEVAFLMSVALNSKHGLPLSLRDRKRAAERLLLKNPQWSDRSIAVVAGLSNKTVGRIRSDLGSALPEANRRTGRDGVAQPVSSAANRARAEAFLERSPDASAREIAEAAGVSLTTAKSIRSRKKFSSFGSPAFGTPGAGTRSDGTSSSTREAQVSGQHYRQALLRLRSDPSIRFTHYGRTLFRMLEVGARDECDWNELASHVPEHCRAAVAEMARLQAGFLARFAVMVDDGAAANSSSL